jgi:hypothetical protein
VEFGPLVNADTRDKVAKLVESATGDGARGDLRPRGLGSEQRPLSEGAPRARSPAAPSACRYGFVVSDSCSWSGRARMPPAVWLLGP